MNSEYWENRYLTRDMPWEKGEASPGLVDFLAVNPALPRGTVCVPGCGTGHDARAFARAGFATFGFDFAPSAVKSAREQSAGLPILYTQADFLHDIVICLFIYVLRCLCGIFVCESSNLCENTRSCLNPQIKITTRFLLLLLNQSVEKRVNVRNEPILL